MPLSNHINKNRLHHAYLLTGRGKHMMKEVGDFLEKELSFPMKANLDLRVMKADSFGIDESRTVKEWQGMKPSGRMKICVIKADGLTLEAQNSLLKVFEEPAENTHFFLILPSAEILLPTLRSRLEHIKMGDSDEETQAGKFLKMDKIERLNFVKPFFAEEEKDRKGAADFLVSLEKEIYRKTSVTKMDEAERTALSQIGKCLLWMGSRSPSVKKILEYICLITPQY